MLDLEMKVTITCLYFTKETPKGFEVEVECPAQAFAEHEKEPWTQHGLALQFLIKRERHIYLTKRESHPLSRLHLVVPEILKIKQRMYFLLAVDEHFRLPIIHLIITLVAKLKIKVFVKKTH